MLIGDLMKNDECKIMLATEIVRAAKRNNCWR
jgi:hypothetical protein